VALRLEQRVKVPKRTFDVPLSRHFVEAHLQQNLAELRTDLQQRMEMATAWNLTLCVDIVPLELSVFPRSCSQHLCS
jgi:hypothetical protein